MNEGQLLGNVFSLPDYPQGGGAGNVGQMPQQSAPDFSKIIPDVQYGLQSTANVADYTHKYYDELAAARQFANTMWHNYRIDVTKPNINNRADVAAANTFSQMLANTQAVANQMKNSQEELKAAKARPNTVINQSAFNQNTPFASLTPDQQYTDVSLDPTSVSTIKEYSGARDNTAIMAQDQKEFDAKMAYLDQAAANATDPAMKNRILQQKAQMIQAQNMYWNPPAEKGDYFGGAGSRPITGLVMDAASVYTGTHGSFEKVPNKLINGYQVFESTANPIIGQPLGTVPVETKKGTVENVQFIPVKVLHYGDKTVAVDGAGREKVLYEVTPDGKANDTFDVTMQKLTGQLGLQPDYEMLKKQMALQKDRTSKGGEVFTAGAKDFLPAEHTAVKYDENGNRIPSKLENLKTNTNLPKEEADKIIKEEVGKISSVNSSNWNKLKHSVLRNLPSGVILEPLLSQPTHVEYESPDIGVKFKVEEKDGVYVVTATSKDDSLYKFTEDNKSSKKFSSPEDAYNYLDKNFNITGGKLFNKQGAVGNDPLQLF